MICHNCGMQLPDDSEFCQYCGSKISVFEEPTSSVEEMRCSNCGMQLPDDSQFCQYCGSIVSNVDEQVSSPVVKDDNDRTDKIVLSPTFAVSDHSEKYENDETEALSHVRRGKKPHKKWLVAVICLSVLSLALTGLNVYQYMTVSKKNEEISLKSNLLTNTISEKTTELSSLYLEITALKSKVSTLKGDADKYKIIVDTVKKGNLGYASNNFRSSESVIVVRENEKNRKFTLTAYWSDAGEVSVDYDYNDPPIAAAYVEFDQDNWSTSTKMTIKPTCQGVSVVTFSNNLNSQTFDVIIIVV